MPLFHYFYKKRWRIIGKHQNENAVATIERRLRTKEHPKGVDFVVNGNAYEYAETKGDKITSISHLKKSRAPGTKKLIVPQKLANYSKEKSKGIGLGIENISGTIIKKTRKLPKNSLFHFKQAKLCSY